MQSWLSVVMACSTILLQANNTAVPQFIDGVAQVISETPWVILKSMFKIPPDCIIIAVDNNAFLVSFGVMVRSRLPVTMLVTTRSKEEFGTMKKMQPKFDVIALLKEDDDKVLEWYYWSTTASQGGKSRKRQLRVSYTIVPPYVLPPGSIGMDRSVIRMMAKSLKLKVSFTYAKSFKALILNVIMGKSDLAISQPSFALQRYSIGLDLSPALTQRTFSFTTRHPVPVAALYTIVYAFEYEVWTATAITIIGVALSLISLSWYYGTGTIFGDISVSFIPLVSESVPDKWYKSRHIKPFFPILFLWILFGFILCQAYKGNLLANLVKVEYEKPLETFQDLLDQRMGMFLPNGTVISFLLKYSPFETHRRAYKECFQERGGYFNSNIAPPHLMARTLRREIVGVLSDDFMAPYRHNFILGKEPLSVGFAGYYYALKLPLKAEIDMVLLVLQSSGILEQERFRYDWILARKDRDRQKSLPGTSPTVIRMEHFLPMLFIVVAGLIITTIVFITENFSGRSRKTNIKKGLRRVAVAK